MNTATARHYHTVDGRVVLEGHPDAHALAYAHGAALPEGLVVETAPEIVPVAETTVEQDPETGATTVTKSARNAKALHAAPATKQVKGPQETK